MDEELDNGGDDGQGSGGMSDGTFFAIAIVLFIIAMLMLFVAFHPGGITDPALQSDQNKEGIAQNPKDVVIYFMNRLNAGEGAVPKPTAVETAAENKSNAPATPAKKGAKHAKHRGKNSHQKAHH